MQRVLSISRPQITSHGDRWGTIRLAPERIVASLFGCWHRRMSWPMTRGRQTYRACLNAECVEALIQKRGKLLAHFTIVINPNLVICVPS